MVNASSRTPGMPCAGMWVLPLIIKSLTVSPAEQIANDSRLMPRLTPKGFNIYRKKTERRDRLTPKGAYRKNMVRLAYFLPHGSTNTLKYLSFQRIVLFFWGDKS